MQRVMVRDRVWQVQAVSDVAERRRLYSLLDPLDGDKLQVLAPPEEVETLPPKSSVCFLRPSRMRRHWNGFRPP